MTKLTRRQSLGLLGALPALPLLATQAQAASHTVRITNFTFEPANLTIAAGDTVTFVNEDGAPHTATADSGAFDTGTLNRGAQASLTFNAAGSFTYFCAIHPSMKGAITIQ